MKPLDDVPPLLPPDEPRFPHIVFSTATDWNAVAGVYAAVVEKQLRGFDAARYLPKFTSGVTRDSKILAIIGKINREIRYTGIEFSEASMVPRRPAEVLERKYGDCKDKSTLAVAMLRSAGIEAHVALLFSSTGDDIEPDLPGLDVFNHAIVYVPGQPEIWLDPTDTDLRLHVVSPANQGRNVLIARPQTTTLTRTPELMAEQNRVIETREFRLSELGRAKVIETSETLGTPDRDYRGAFGDLDQKKLRETLKSYIDWTYGEAKIEDISVGEKSDLSQPLKLKIELNDAQRGTSGRTEAVVAIFVSQIVQRLPKSLREEVAPQKDDSKPAVPPRTQDFSIQEPFTHEWHYIIRAPTGFRIRQLPEAKEEQLGPATLTTRFRRETDTTVFGDFRFVMPKRRFSAAEGEALRDAAVELGKRKPLVVYFDQIGETDLASGKAREALAEFASLQRLHPREALHAMQTARALLVAGVGEAARAEARQAVAMEPSSAKAYIQLAEVLKHDLVGRPMQKGFDMDGAAAAYRKALDLDPKDDETRANLAILLEYDRSGFRYGSGSKLEEAIVEYKKLIDKLASLGIPQNYGVALLRAGHFQELQAYLGKQPDTENNHVLLVCAEGMLKGPEAAIRQAGAVSGVEAKQRVLASAAQTLIGIRQYDLAAGLYDAVAAGSQNPAAIANVVQMLRRTKRVETAPALKDPEDALRLLFWHAMKQGREEDWTEMVSAFTFEARGPAALKAFQHEVAIGLAKIQGSGLSPEVGYDLMQSTAQYAREGSDTTGWVIRVTYPGSGAAAGQSQAWFIVKENERYRVLGGEGGFEGVARLVLKLVDQGHTDQAKIWLDRVREELPAGSGDDPLAGPLFSRIWQQGSTADVQSIRRGAVMLLTGEKKDIEVVVATLEEARQSADAAKLNAISGALAEAYFSAKQYAKALAVSERLLGDLPQSATALALALRSAYAARGQEEADRIARQSLDRFKNNVNGLRIAAVTAMLFGDTNRSNSIERQIIDSGRGQANDYNQIAWADLMAGKVTAETLALANKGMLIAGNESTGLMHTLAAVDAELGKEADARATLLQRMKVLGAAEPDDEEWYVFGRIAEQYGLTQEAAAMYRRLTKPQNELAIAASSYALAQRRLKTIELLKK